MNRAAPFYGNRKRTRADHAAALTSVLIMRVKPYSERDIASIARIHATTAEQVKARLRELGRGHLIEAEAWAEPNTAAQAQN